MIRYPGITALLLAAVCAGCGQPADTAADTNAQVCQQVNVMLDRSAAGELAPRDWANMMVAGARLLYVERACGDRVAAAPAELCADLNARIVAFAEAPGVPKNDNRTNALQTNLKVYREAGCEPALAVE